MDTREGDIERFLKGYGQIRDITLKKGYGFVVRKPSRLAEPYNKQTLTILKRFYLGI